MTTDDTREALTAMVREGEAAGMYATTDHGAAGFCTDHAQVPARDALTEVAYRAWCDARKGKPEAPGEYEALYSRTEAGWMTHVVAAVVAALDDLPRTALRRVWEERQEASTERDAARAALDQVRAVVDKYGDIFEAPPAWRYTRGLRAALDPEEGR